jgi:hypothetical protein
MTDVRNQASIPKTDSEMKIVTSLKMREKYTNLNENE